MWLIGPFLFLGLLSPCVRGADDLTVNLTQGNVRGHLDPDGGFYAFYGIPYATAPTGDNKFKAPLPGPVWSDTLDAVDDTVICPQKIYSIVIPSKKKIKEDCLIANVFVPDTKEKNLPVVVHIHGGAYRIGFGNLLTFKNFIKSKKIIFVTFNFRLGPHGFLCLGTEDAPGNAGMKDQVALLRWVNQNIAAFGGNPKDVTLDGFSSGASSIDLLMLSKSARGLFHKAIPESGAGVAAFSIQTDPIANAKEYAKLLNYTGSDSVADLEKYYKSQPLDLLMSADVSSRKDSVYLMSPCLEPKGNNNSFITESPVNILKRGAYPKVPMLYGFTAFEGLYRLNLFDKWKQDMNVDFEPFLTPDLKFKSEDEKKNVSREIKEFYFGNSTIDDNQVLNFINYFSDVIFIYPMLRSVKLLVESGHKQVYLYDFKFVHADLPIIPHTNIRGAGHSSQTYTVADDGLPSTNYSNTRLQEMRNLTRSIWLNFISTGRPIPKGSKLPRWPAVKRLDRSPYMALDLQLHLKCAALKKRARFWDRIYAKYFKQPVSPSALTTNNQTKNTIE
ncbi:esterase-6-like [Leptidea sinapis]|uniref:esterase-6-like n=1 Tax=Leptidea sinapis TaxID=189913 RepID=UPI0021359622|nr:esterase-6-like [Leptidea sinapis]